MVIQSLIKVSKGQENSRNLLGLFVLISLGLQGLLLVGWFAGLILTSTIASKPAPSLVQLANGEGIVVAPLGNKERTPAVIQTFVRDSLATLFTWTGYLPNSEAHRPQLDPGVVVNTTFTPRTTEETTGEFLPETIGSSGNRHRKVTTAAWKGSFTLSADFRNPFLAKLAQITPQSVFEGKLDLIFLPLEIREPEPLEIGKWKVVVIANLMVFEGRDLKTIIPFQKEVFVQSVEVPQFKALSPLMPTDDQPGATTPLGMVIAQIRAAGLEIYAIRDYQREAL